MKNNLLKLALLGTFALASGAFAATATSTDTLNATATAPAVSVTVNFADPTTGAALTDHSYPIANLVNGTYVYGAGFKIKMSYANVRTSVSLILSRAEASPDSTYTLAYRTTAAGGNTASPAVSFDATGVTVGSATNPSATDTYVVTSNTFSTIVGDAATFEIGARSTADSKAALAATVTLTATAN